MSESPTHPINVVCPARPNLIPDLIEALATAGVNIETLDTVTLSGTVVATLTVDRYDEAIRALTAAGFPAVNDDAILVRVDDRPGALAALARRFHQANIPLESVRIVRRAEGSGLVALSTPRTAEALELVRDVLIG